MRCKVVKTSDSKLTAAVIEKKLGIDDYKVIDEKEIRIYDESVSSEVINRTLVTEGIGVSEIYETGISLEDYFKTLVGGIQ